MRGNHSVITGEAGVDDDERLVVEKKVWNFWLLLGILAPRLIGSFGISQAEQDDGLCFINNDKAISVRPGWRKTDGA